MMTGVRQGGVIRVAIVSLLLLAACGSDNNGSGTPAAPTVPTIHTANYPRTMLSFRFTDHLFTQPVPPLTLQELDAIYTLPNGFMPTNTTTSEWTQIADAHPDKFALWFHQGMALSDVRTMYDLVDRSAFFAGHWLHYQGSLINQNVPATAGQSVIPVADTTLFLADKYANPNSGPYADDVTLVALGANNIPDWNIAEEVRLVSVDPYASTITVDRGQYGSTPLAFAAGGAIASAHAMFYWGRKQAVPPSYSWVLNFATDSPVDATGKRAADIFMDILAPQMQPGGALQSYDGIELDAVTANPNETGVNGNRIADTSGDGVGDGGMRAGVNVFELGLYRFIEQLGTAWPDKVITTGDSDAVRFVGITNGVELEWWPAWGDGNITHWSTGLNRLGFWTTQAMRLPRFTFANHWVGGYGAGVVASIPAEVNRLVFAGATMGDAVLTSMYMPPPEADENQMGFWDEWRQGTDRVFGWLGQPVEPMRRLAAETFDELGGVGVSMSPSIQASLSGVNIAQFDVTTTPGVLTVIPTAGVQSASMALAVSNFPGGDFFLRFRISADKTAAHAAVDIARELKVSLPTSAGTENALVHTSEEEVAFYFRSVPKGNTSVQIAFEGDAPIHISNMTLHNYPDVTSRLFSKGIILANPSDAPFVFDLGMLAPGRTYRRLQASTQQDNVTNDGTAVGATVSVPLRDALFLLQTN